MRKKKKPWSRNLRAIVAFLVSAAVMSLFFLRSGFAGYIATAAVSVLAGIIAWASGKPEMSSRTSDSGKKESSANVTGTKRASERVGGQKTTPSPKKNRKATVKK